MQGATTGFNTRSCDGDLSTGMVLIRNTSFFIGEIVKHWFCLLLLLFDLPSGKKLFTEPSKFPAGYGLDCDQEQGGKRGPHGLISTRL